jgi:hypothetical protein
MKETFDSLRFHKRCSGNRYMSCDESVIFQQWSQFKFKYYFQNIFVSHLQLWD